MHVSYQLAGFNSSGVSKGALVHFSEEKASDFTPPSEFSIPVYLFLYLTPPALTPWIALVSCDKNATNASMEEDIFTLARDKGAVSAVCIRHPLYASNLTNSIVQSAPILIIIRSLCYKPLIFRSSIFRSSIRHIL